MPKTQEKEARIAIITPYLFDKIESHGFSEEFMREQVEKYGHNPDNLNGVKLITTPSRIVRIDSPEICECGGHVSDFEIAKTLATPVPADLVISGSTKGIETKIVPVMARSGFVVARYSIFYGGASGYTGMLPEQAGYALDIPKDPQIARALISDDMVLDALVERDARKIRSAVESLNSRIEQPVLVTPALEKVLEIRRK